MRVAERTFQFLLVDHPANYVTAALAPMPEQRPVLRPGDALRSHPEAAH